MGLNVYHKQPGQDKVIRESCFLQKVAAHEAVYRYVNWQFPTEPMKQLPHVFSKNVHTLRAYLMYRLIGRVTKDGRR